jgi:hypothetical protein
MGREMGEPWNFSQHQPLLEACLRHPSDSLRLSTLGLCVDSHSSVEAFSRPELDLIRGFLLRSLVLASPASRQEKGADCIFFLLNFPHWSQCRYFILEPLAVQKSGFRIRIRMDPH